MTDHSHGNQGTSGSGAGRWIFWGFALVAAYFLLSEHRAHTIQYLPFLLLLACPIMHLFHGHGRHGGHDDDGGMDERTNRQSAEGREKTGSSHD